MPEGDTIFKAARTLDRALSGHEVVEFQTELAQLARVDDDQKIAGRTVERVSAVGKHLLIHFSGDLVLRTHMRMHGSWHIYRRGERWRRARSSMRVVIATAQFEAVGFNIPVAEFISASALARNRELRRLGPDVLAEEFDPEAAVERLRQHPADEIGNALLNQTIAAGIGNVFKSEILFVCRVDPFRRVDSLDAETALQLFEVARRQMKENVTAEAPGSRRTTGRLQPAEALYVYGRAKEPCRRCGTPIHWRKQGADSRSTYWCPTCQK
jgi:endonuclease-8